MLCFPCGEFGEALRLGHQHVTTSNDLRGDSRSCLAISDVETLSPVLLTRSSRLLQRVRSASLIRTERFAAVVAFRVLFRAPIYSLFSFYVYALDDDRYTRRLLHGGRAMSILVFRKSEVRC